MFHKSYILLWSTIFFAGIFAADHSAASSSVVSAHQAIEVRSYLTEVRMTPYEGILTPYYKAENDFICALRSGNLPVLQAMLDQNPKFIHNRYKGNITPLHIICAMEHFNKKYDIRAILNLFFEAADKENSRVHYWTEKEANISKRAFYQLCTGEELKKHTFPDIYANPLEVAASYPNVETLKVLLEQSAIRGFVMHRNIIYNPIFDTHFDLYKHLVKHRLATCGPGCDFDRNETRNDLIKNGEYQYSFYKFEALKKIIQATIQHFGIKGIQMLNDEGVIVSSIDDECIKMLFQATIDTFEKEHPEEKDAIAHLKPKPSALSYVFTYVTSYFPRFSDTVLPVCGSNTAETRIEEDQQNDAASHLVSSEPFSDDEV